MQNNYKIKTDQRPKTFTSKTITDLKTIKTCRTTKGKTQFFFFMHVPMGLLSQNLSMSIFITYLTKQGFVYTINTKVSLDETLLQSG